MNLLGNKSAASDFHVPYGDVMAGSFDTPAIRERLDERKLDHVSLGVGAKPTNLVSVVEQFLRPEVVVRAASVMGCDAVLLGRAFRAGVPGLLWALTSLVSKPGGVVRLYALVTQQQLSSLMGLAGLLDVDKRAVTVVAKGLTGLTSLLGEDTVLALTRSVCRYAGLGNTASRCVIGLLGAIVLGVLEQQRRAKGLDPDQFGQLISSQSDHIANALPKSFAEYLRDAAVLDSLAYR
jgi:hypothetical protein